MITDSLPEDLFKNRCLALYADAEKLPGKLFKTEIKIVLKDCFGQLVYESEIGSTREKCLIKPIVMPLEMLLKILNFSIINTNQFLKISFRRRLKRLS